VNGFTVWQKNYTEIATAHFRNPAPESDSPIALDRFGFRCFYHTLNPFNLNYGTIRSLPASEKVAVEFHVPSFDDWPGRVYRQSRTFFVGLKI
jgi:hypothetical protein